VKINGLNDELILTFSNWLQNGLFTRYFTFFLLRSECYAAQKKVTSGTKIPIFSFN